MSTFQPTGQGPLASLYTDRFTCSNLKFPSDLGTSSRKLHWITFIVKDSNKSIIEKDTIQTFAISENVINTGNTYLNNLNTKNSTDIKNFKEILNTSSVIADNKVSNFLANDIQSITGAVKNFVDWVIKPPTAQIVAYISLFIPDSISFNQKAYYKNESLTEAFGNIGLTGQTTGSILDSLGNENYKEAFKNLAAGATEFFSSQQKKFNPNILLNSSGLAVNPQTEVLFTTIDFRTFQFDFLLTPRNEIEANEIRQIIQAFKYYSAPGLDSNNNRYFLIPSVFDIMFFYNGEENLNIPKIKTCVLTSVYSDYAPNGWVTHDDGTPVQTRLTLQFQENQIVTKKDINEGLY